MGNANRARIGHSLASLIQTLAVVEYLNFRHTANALGVAQSSVSARVKALGDDVNANTCALPV